MVPKLSICAATAQNTRVQRGDDGGIFVVPGRLKQRSCAARVPCLGVRPGVQERGDNGGAMPLFCRQAVVWITDLV